MGRKKRLRIAAICMFIAAVLFVVAALSNPGFGSSWFIGDVKITAHIMRILYGVYALVVICLFALSFIIKD